MEIKINSVIPGQSYFHKVEVFGYNSKSQPGLEINGLNGKGRLIKEKITYLSKKRKLKYPLKRFVLCVEGEGLDKSQVEFLELPLLICFWSMAGILPLKRLDNCFAAARVTLDGVIDCHLLNEDILNIIAMDYGDGESEPQSGGSRLLYLGSDSTNSLSLQSGFLQPMDIITYLNQNVGGFRGY